MLNDPLIAIVVSIILGFLAGLGVGGGSLLVLWLTIVLGWEHNTARIVNLLFFIPSAIIASFFRFKKGSLHFKQLLPAIITGCIGAAVFSYVGKILDTAILKKIFGGLLLITGFRELLYKPKRTQLRERKAK